MARSALTALTAILLVACSDPGAVQYAGPEMADPGPDAETPYAPRAPLVLTTAPLVAGQSAWLSSSGAISGETVHFIRSFGTGAGPCPPELGGLCLDLDPATAALVGSAVANGAGVATLNVPVPAGAGGMWAATQAAIVRGAGGATSVKSNALLQQISSGVTVGLGSLSTGDLIVNEIMNNPVAADDAWAEWFEIHNTTASDVELQGLLVEDFDTDSFTIGSSVIVPAGGFAVIGRDGNPLLNGGVTVDYMWSNMALGNSADELVLSYGATTFDTVAWDNGVTFPDPTGASISLDPLLANSASNDFGASWCTVTAVFGDGDNGSPGAANPSCGGGGPTDVDGDGHSPPSDCDDSNPSVYPGAPEICDGLDNDCVGGPGPTEVDANGDGVLDCLGGVDCGLSGYAGTTSGLSGTALMNELEDLTSAQTCSSYTGARDFMFVTLDKVAGYVECVYTGQLVAVGSSPPNSNTMNTEHTWPQSLGAGSNPAKCDLHHLFPTMSNVNSSRGNLPLDDVVTVTDTYGGGSVRGTNATGQTVFEPRDSHKGNAARALLYMATRHGFSISGSEIARYQAWHALDPVDADELDRTWDIAAEQVLTNPYVVCPQFVDLL